MDHLLKADELSEWLGLPLARIWELCRENKIPHILVGQRQYRFSKERTQQWIDGGGNRVAPEEIQNENI
jgi:excisionase family DNA binding protein